MKIYLITILLLNFCIQISFSQIREFKVPAGNDGFLILKLKNGDSLKVMEDSAFAMSSVSYHTFLYIANKIESYQGAFDKIDNLNNSFGEYLKGLNQIQELLKTTQNVGNQELADIIKNLTQVKNSIDGNIDKLKELNDIIKQKTDELNDIKKKLNWHRFKNIFFKFGDWIVAGAIGVAVGMAIK